MALTDAIISVNSQPTLKLLTEKKNTSGFSLYIVHVITSFNCMHALASTQLYIHTASSDYMPALYISEQQQKKWDAP